MLPVETPDDSETLDVSAEQKTAPVSPPGQAMVRKLADLIVLPQSKLSNNERNFVGDLLVRAMENVDLSVRQEVAFRLAGFGDMPTQLQRTMLNDDIAVSSPLLQYLTAISESLLLEVCQLGYEYRRVIAFRDNLTPSVVDRVVSYGEIDLIVVLLKRDDIELSCGTMDNLVARSEIDESIQPHLIKRPELSLEQGLRMFWWLKSPLRKSILSRFAIDRSIIQESMHSLFVQIFTNQANDPHVKSILKLIDRRHRPRGRHGEVVTMDVVQQTLRFARQSPTDESCHAVGLLAGVSTDTAGKALRDMSGEAFAILCKSIGLSRTAFLDLLIDDETDVAALHYSDEKRDDLIGAFDSIARDYSRTILRYWDWKHDLYTQTEAKLSAMPIAKTDTDNGYFGAI